MQFKDAPDNLKELRKDKDKVKFNDKQIQQQKVDNVNEKQINNLKQTINEINKTNIQLTAENSELLQQINKKDQEIDRYQLQQHKTEERNNLLQFKQQQIVNLEQEIEQLQAKYTQLQETLVNQKLNNGVDNQQQDPQVHSTINNKHEQHEQYIRKYQRLQLELDQKKSAILKVQEKKSQIKYEYEQQIRGLSLQLQQYEAEFNQMDQENKQSINRVNSMKKQNHELILHIKSLESQLEVLKSIETEKPNEIKYMIEIQNQRNENLHLRQTVAQLEYQQSELTTQIHILKERVSTMETFKKQKEQLENEIILLEQDNERLKSKNRTDLEVIQRTKEEFQTKEQELLDLRYNLDVKQFSLRQTIKYTQEIKDENEYLTEQLRLMQEQLNEMRLLYQKQQEDHESEILLIREKLKIEQVQVNNRVIKQIPIQVVSPYQIPTMDRHYC